jgi:hypothetical protein
MDPDVKTNQRTRDPPPLGNEFGCVLALLDLQTGLVAKLWLGSFREALVISLFGSGSRNCIFL